MPWGNNENKKVWARGYNQRVRIEALNHYGGQCVCCGESRWQLLSFDHKDHYKGDSSPHRPTGFIGLWLRSRGYPDYIQVLCHNCNHCRADYGICIHEQENI